MPRIRLVIAVWLALLVGFSATPALAQADSPFPDFTQFEGLQSAVSRAYELDFSQFEMEETEGSPVEFRDALFLAGIVLELETSEQAAAGYEMIVDHGATGLATSMGIETPQTTEIPLDDLGDQAQAFSTFSEASSTEGFLRQVVMQQENYVFVAVILTEAEEASLDADALVAYFSEQVSAAPTGAGTLVEEGGSTGGLFDFFPAADHELYAGLIPGGDEIIFPVGG